MVKGIQKHLKGEIPYEKITKELIKQSRLSVAYNALFDNRLENMFKEIFPEIYPYGIPLMPDELWEGKGYWEGHTPLKETFPKWYIVEHLGLNEENRRTLCTDGFRFFIYKFYFTLTVYRK